MSTESEVLQHALVLPSSQRANIACKLLESLESDPCDPDADTAWADEIESRASAYDRGEVTALDADQVFESARRGLERGTQ